MLKYCKDKWSKNEELLRQALSFETLDCLEYKDLVKLTVKWILNGEENDFWNWDYNNITCIDNGDYQGTLLYLIPKNTYQPAEYQYLMTYVDYGSCSGCDTLQSIQSKNCEVSEYMKLCKDIVCNIVKPYNYGWRNEEEFDIVEE